tara:strand:+ start:181 stop:501 length:321 start_codon:yes stop_codon:yes gene_type:complete
MSDANGWENYSKLVLQQLETLSSGIEVLREELQEVKSELIELRAKEDRIQEIRVWKEKLDDVASPPQLREAMKDLSDLKEFKTKAMTVFMVVQVLMGAMIAIAKII